MINQTLIFLTTFLIINSCTSNLIAQQNSFIDDYLERLETSRKYLIQVAEIMPNEKYDFKTHPESRSFAEDLMHIGYAMDWHCQSLLGGRKPRDYDTDTLYHASHKSKKEMITIINKTFNEVIKFIQRFDTTQLNNRLDYFGLNRTKRQILLLLADHITHHRAQMLISLRLNKLNPPKYVIFQ